MTSVRVEREDERGGSFSVVVREDDGSETSHRVLVPEADWQRLGAGYETREQLVEASFRYLLEREPKESVLRSFELGVIASYFPDYPDVIAAAPRD